MPDIIPAPSNSALSRQRVPFTSERQATFCEALATHGNVRLAARAAGITHTTAYRQRRISCDFREVWDGALVLARAHAEEVLADRALNGVEEKVFYHGEEVATRRRFDARLLLAHLDRLDKLARNGSAHKAATFFDMRLAMMRGEGGEFGDDPSIGAADDDGYLD